jgi:hypothetical protein
MTKLLPIILCLHILSCSNGPNSSTIKSEKVESIFSERFFNNYQDRACGKNILGFAEALQAEGVNTEDYRIVKITNQGSGSLGMVNAQSARTILFNRPAAGELNWYHHVVLMHEPTGTIYDFDYQASPTPVAVKSYIQSMFLDEPECARPIRDLSTFCVGVNQKLDSYLWELSPVSPSAKPTSKMMREIFQSY